jgi:hypothetical protein
MTTTPSSAKSGKKSDSAKHKDKGKDKDSGKHRDKHRDKDKDRDRDKDRKRSDNGGSKGRDDGDSRRYLCLCICRCPGTTSVVYGSCRDCRNGIHQMCVPCLFSDPRSKSEDAAAANPHGQISLTARLGSVKAGFPGHQGYVRVKSLEMPPGYQALRTGTNS